MLSGKENKRLSKFLSYLLRHNPGELGIILDEQGWTDVDRLVEKISEREALFSLDVLHHIVETNSKKRFAFNPDHSKIRASQGHSVDIDLHYEPKLPPAVLYHGTAEKNLVMIMKEGLHKMERHHVHLSADRQTAFMVGQRHGKPAVLEIDTIKMVEAGYRFFLSDNEVWLTAYVPVEYIRP